MVDYLDINQVQSERNAMNFMTWRMMKITFERATFECFDWTGANLFAVFALFSPFFFQMI